MAVAFVAGSAIMTTTTTIPSNGTSNQTVTSTAFTPAVNDIIIVKIATWDTLTTVVSVSGGGLTWTGHGPYNATNTAPVYLYTAQATSATSMTVSVVFKCTDTYAGTAGFVVERYSGGQLAATPAIGTLTNDTTNANASITTTAANSLVAWIDSDYNGVTGTATYSSGSTQTVAPYQNSSNLCIYSAYRTTTTAGTYTFGMSAPTGQAANLAGIEIQPVASSPTTLADGANTPSRATGPGESVFAGPASTLVSDFTVMPSFFDGNYGGTAVISGQLNVPCVSSYAAGTPAVQRVSLVGSQVFCQVVQACGASGTRQNSIKLIIDGNNSVEMLYGGGTFTGRVQKNGTNSDLTLPAYNSVSHQWWRMRESGGTLYWDAAPDGLTWTNLGSATHGLNLQSLKLNLQAGYYGTETSPPNAIYDNLNSVPVTRTDPAGGTGRALDALDGWNAAVQPNITALDTAGPPAYAPAPAADGAVQPSWASDTAGPPVYAPRAGADTLALGVVAVDPAGGLARSSSTTDQVFGGGTKFDTTQGTVRALGAADGVGLTDLEAGGSSQVQALGGADAVGAIVVDPAGGLTRASSTPDTDPIGDTLADVPPAAAARALGAVDAQVGGTLLPDAAGGVVRASGGGADAVAVGVTVGDTAGAPGYAPLGVADFTVGGGVLELAGAPVRAVWSPDTAAVQASSADTAGIPVRALGATDAAAISGVSADPSVGAVRALNAPDVTPRVDVAVVDTPGVVRLWSSLDAWSAWQVTTPGVTPGGSTFPGQSPDLGGPSRFNTFQVVGGDQPGAGRALGQPDAVSGATAGGLSNLPILRVLADFTQGPPGRPASTAGGTTVELTQAMAATSMTIRRGRQYELGKPQAGTAQITFSDPSELLNPTNASSPYNSGSASLVSYRPMRVTAVWRGTLYVLYTGYIERYPQTWEDAGFRGVKPLECVDGLAMLSNTEVHQSYFETIAADNPSIYIPYDEASAPARVYVASSKALLSGGSSLPGNPRQGTSAYYQTQLLVGGTALRVVTSTGQGASVNYAGDTLPDGTPALALSSKAKDPTSTDTSRPIARADTAGGSFNLNTGGSTIEFWYRWSSGNGQMVCESVTDGDFDYPSGWFTGFYCNAGKSVFALGNNGTYYYIVGSTNFQRSNYPDGQWHYAALTYTVSGGNVVLTATYDNQEFYVTTSYTPQWLGINSVHAHASSDYGDPQSAFSVAQFAYYPTPLTQTQRLTHYNRGIGYAGEYPSDRFTRLMNTYWGGAINMPVPSQTAETLDADFVYGVYPGVGVANATTPQPYTVLQAQQMVDIAAQSVTYFDIFGNATFEDRRQRIGRLGSVVLTGVFGDGPGELPYTALEYDYDPTYVYTRTQVTKSQGGQVITNDNTAAQGNYGVRSYSDTVQLYNEFDLFQLGMHILALYSTQRIRIRRLEIDPAAVGSDALWQIVLGLEMSQRFTVRRRTASGLFSQDFFVEQIEHTIDPASSTWKVRLQMSPVLYAGNPGYVDLAGYSTLGVSTQVRY